MGTGRAGDAMPAFDTLLTPAVEQQHPQLWLRAAMSAAIPVLGFRGPQAFAELLSRCETRAVELDDELCQALSRWLLGMSPSTDRELLRQAREHDKPFAVALAAIRLAIDTASRRTRDAHARRCSRPTLPPPRITAGTSATTPAPHTAGKNWSSVTLPP